MGQTTISSDRNEIKTPNGKSPRRAKARANAVVTGAGAVLAGDPTTLNPNAPGFHGDETASGISRSDLRELLRVLKAVRRGDFSSRMPTDHEGLMGDLAEVVNDIISLNEDTLGELVRVAEAVGKNGHMHERANIGFAKGAWEKGVRSVNSLIDDLVQPTHEFARVITSVARGDLSQKMALEIDGRPVKKEFHRIGVTVNAMVDQLSSFASEVTRVASEVGTEGKLGGQAEVKGLSGIWKDLTDSVNSLAGNLTVQVRNISKVTTAVASGDLSQKITVDAKGEILQLKETINTMVDQLSSFAAEVTRVAKEVGTEGKLGGQANVRGVAGTWRDLTEHVNAMASNLTAQVRSIAKVTTAVARGDLSQKILVDARGEILELKETINTMVDQLSSFSIEVTRVAKEVGTEGKLGGQAAVPGVAGIWKDLTDNVNAMASNLTVQLRDVSKVATAIANGDLTQKITVDVKGEILQIKDVINMMVDQLSSFASEVTRVAKEVGTEGKLGGQATVRGVSGTWKDLTDNVNVMASNLTKQVRGIVKVVTAVANGDLTQKLTLEAQGEVAALAETINSMTDTLRIFADQVTTVAREVGLEGKLGGQAKVPGASGTWKDLTDNVNVMASNLTKQVRGIVRVVTAVANGDLTQKLMLEAKGEVAALADTINSMTDTLRTFADQVTTVSREVGIEGKLGGQAKVPGASGTWKDLTGNVNAMASNLTSQVRAIAEVATAVTKGDLTRSIKVEAQGEVAALKDNINQMISNLKDTTQKNKEQTWLKTNLAKFSGMLQGQRNTKSVAELIMSELTPVISAHYGTFYLMDNEEQESRLNLIASYAFTERKGVSSTYRLREGLVGQCAFEKKRIMLTKVPTDYVQISSSLGEGQPLNIILLPVLFEGEVKAVIELASFEPFSNNHLTFLDQLMYSIGVVLNMIASSMRTEELLQELKRSNAELEHQAKELEDKAQLLEVKHREVELARTSIEEKAEQLSLISKYKSEFLANMSHELRTPLNSLLILSRTLAENKNGNLSTEQVKFAKTIHTSGNDLLTLINEILDLSKVEAGKMRVEPQNVTIDDVGNYLEQTFRPVAEHRQLQFEIQVDKAVPNAIQTDVNRLHQILRNLLSNAFKFTDHGGVTFSVSRAPRTKLFATESLSKATSVIAFSVKDSGIGIPKDKQAMIFEAFQQADGTTSRRYGGTGLGLTISREIARLLGGAIEVESNPGVGSTFTLYVPERYLAPELVISSPKIDSSGEGLAYNPETDLELEGKKVLVVDDDMRNIFAITTLLEEKKMQVRYAENGRDALSVLTVDRSIDLVLMDVMMPEMDGLQATQRLREIPELRSKPVIFLTAKAMQDDRERCLAAGGSDYLTKPVEPNRLYLSMAHCLKNSSEALN